MSREIMQQALDALENAKIVMGNLTSDNCSDCMYIPVTKSIAALKAELAKPEQEPTLFFGRAVYFADPRTGEILPPPDLSIEANQVAYDVAMHYANKTKEKLAKPEREWVGLTDKEMELLVIQAREVPIEIPCDSFTTRLLKLAEAKLKEKNTTNQ